MRYRMMPAYSLTLGLNVASAGCAPKDVPMLSLFHWPNRTFVGCFERQALMLPYRRVENL
jgi:hypothetical protein